MQSTDNEAIKAQATAAINKPQLSYGSTGDAVKELQKLLNHWGCHLTIDGQFGAKTLSAVKAYQKRVFLTADGIVGNNTWQALYSGAPVNMPTLKTGSQGQAVMTLQTVLRQTGDYQGSVDGIFGPITDAAVRKFQARAGLVADGIVASKTWYALSKTQPLAC
jgi:peptidoglycan hydrolase-like protein with peptidoglycan-binding domain